MPGLINAFNRGGSGQQGQWRLPGLNMGRIGGQMQGPQVAGQQPVPMPVQSVATGAATLPPQRAVTDAMAKIQTPQAPTMGNQQGNAGSSYDARLAAFFNRMRSAGNMAQNSMSKEAIQRSTEQKSKFENGDNVLTRLRR